MQLVNENYMHMQSFDKPTVLPYRYMSGTSKTYDLAVWVLSSSISSANESESAPEGLGAGIVIGTHPGELAEVKAMHVDGAAMGPASGERLGQLGKVVGVRDVAMHEEGDLVPGRCRWGAHRGCRMAAAGDHQEEGEQSHSYSRRGSWEDWSISWPPKCICASVAV